MAGSIKIRGIDAVLLNLRKEVTGIQNRSKAGFRKAALLVRERSVRQTPVDTGNLRNSAYTEVYEGTIMHGPGAIVGYTAAYAPFVHEIDKNYRKGNWKFLENALNSSRQDILDILKNAAKV